MTFGLSFENPDQYIGGSAGGGVITLPAACSALGGTQPDNAANISTGTNTTLSTPTVAPDIIAKIALDPSSRFHLELAGITSQFKVWNPNTVPRWEPVNTSVPRARASRSASMPKSSSTSA